MREGDIILGLFYSDENNLIYDEIKESTNLSEEMKEEIKTLSLKFMGPLFMATASEKEKMWRIELIESSLSLFQDKSFDADIMQSFFIMNSLKKTSRGITLLSGIIGSPYAEDVKVFYDKLDKYIHPSINQGKLVTESIFGGVFNWDNYIRHKLEQGLEFLNFSIGTSRKMYWEESQTYYCVAVLERISEKGSNITNLYTFAENSELRKEMLNYIPSYYFLSILPDYYEKLILNTLKIFHKISIFPNIRVINLKNNGQGLLYLEEFLLENDIKKSIGLVLVPISGDSFITEKIPFYRKKLRMTLDRNKKLEEQLFDLNADIEHKKWSTKTDQDLENIKNLLDKEE